MGWTVLTTGAAGSHSKTVYSAQADSEGYWKYDKEGNLIDEPIRVDFSDGSGTERFKYKGEYTITLGVACDGNCVVTAGGAYYIAVVTRTESNKFSYDIVRQKTSVEDGGDEDDAETQYVSVDWTASGYNSYGKGYLQVKLYITYSASSEIWIWEDDEEEEDDDDEEEEETYVSRPVVTPTKTVEKTVTTSADGTTIDTVTVTTERTVVLGGIYYNEVPITSVWKTDNITNVTNCNGDTATETTTTTTVTERTETGSDSATTESGNVTTTTTTSTTKTLTEVEADYII